MPEVAGGAAYLVDPYDIDQIAQGITALATDEGLRQDLIHKGANRAQDFSWERTAKIILDGIEGLD
jgi:glycosyltransferase involved in cell wall biosynthesis